MSTQRLGAVVDNWLLEFACRLLNPEVDASYYAIDTYRGYYAPWNRSKFSATLFARDKVLALVQLLELIVVSERLVYDADWSHRWTASGTLADIDDLLQPIEATGRSRKRDEEQQWQIDTKNDTPDIVRDGALYYLELARTLGIPYWPSPQRAQFLADTEYAQVGYGFVLQLRSEVDSALSRLIDEAVRPLALNRSTLTLPGFGSTILRSVNSREGILAAALTLRESREAIGFRAWIREMDFALESGNVKKLSSALRDIQALAESARANLGLERKADGLEFTIGLAPSIKSNIGAVQRLFKTLQPKDTHISFLRRHFSDVLESADLLSQIVRLFPEYSNQSSSLLLEERPANHKRTLPAS